MASLQDSVDRLTGAFDRMADRLESLEGTGGVATSDADAFTRHIRRYMPFYALATVWALMLILLPTRDGGDNQAEQASQVSSGASEAFDGGGGSVAAAGPSSGGSTRRNGGSTTTSQPVKTTVGPGGQITTGFDPLAWQATGKTRGGFDCGPNVRQLPWSAYAVPCHPAWSGNNGGSTSRGVTAKEIVVVERRFPSSANDQAIDAVVQQAGFASEDERQATRAEFIKYFNKTFELWGRQIKIIVYESEYGNDTDEALSKGKEGACADADSIVAKYKPFAVVGEGATSPFGECAAERKIFMPNVAPYYPETWYRKHHPYLWGGVMECERIAYQNAEYIGKRLADRPAKWAKSLQKGKPRKFGTWVPNNDQYQHCVKLSEKELKEKYGQDPEESSRYNYPLDIQRWPDEAARAVVQFNADGVTTIVLASDPISPIFLTQSARGQEYFPEWITNGAGLTDVDQFARLWDQEEVQWSLFGMSQLGDVSRILSEEGEGSTTYRHATGTKIPPGAQVEYSVSLNLFNMMQAAGPILTPENLAAAIWRLPPGGAPDYEGGLIYFRTAPNGGKGVDHTGIDDHKEIYYLCTNIGGGDAGGSSRCSEPKAPDGAGGMYVATYGGKRFTNGTWPKGDPPVFPEYKP